MLTNIVIGFLFIALLETINGIFRIKVLFIIFKNNKIRNLVSLFIGIIIIFIFSYFYIPFINLKTFSDSFIIGVSWSSLMIIFDIFVGRFLFNLTWNRIMDDFNNLKGNFLSIGIIFIILIPSIVFYINRY